MSGSTVKSILPFLLAFMAFPTLLGQEQSTSRKVRIPTSIRTSVSYGPKGNVCAALIRDCTDSLRRSATQLLHVDPREMDAELDRLRRVNLVHRAVDALAPPGTRGAQLPGGKRSIGNCIDEHEEEYENVSVYFNDNACSATSATITWKGPSCEPGGTIDRAVATLAQADLCAESFSRLLEGQKGQARVLNGHAALLEQLAAQIQDVKLKEALLQQARSFKDEAAFTLKSAEELMPK